MTRVMIDDADPIEPNLVRAFASRSASTRVAPDVSAVLRRARAEDMPASRRRATWAVAAVAIGVVATIVLAGRAHATTVEAAPAAAAVAVGPP